MTSSQPIGQAKRPATDEPASGKLTVSVVMPNHNDARFVGEAIESILRQSRPPDEFLILDDASTDESPQIIESYARRIPWIRFERSHENLGVNRAHRYLFERATGDYVHALAADDARYPDFLQHAMVMAEQHPQAGIIFGRMVIVDGSGAEQGECGIRKWQAPLYASPQRYLRDFLLSEPPSHSLVSSTVFRRDAFAEIGWYCEELGSWGDTLATHAIALKYGACYVPERFAIWRKLADSYSQQNVADPRRTLEFIERAARTMRSSKFQDRFPESLVRAWRRRYRWRVIREFWRGDLIGLPPPGSSVWTRYRYRLPRTWEAWRLARYVPK